MGEGWKRWFISLLSQPSYTLGKALQPAYKSNLSYKADKIQIIKILQILSISKPKEKKQRTPTTFVNTIWICSPPFIITFAICFISCTTFSNLTDLEIIKTHFFFSRPLQILNFFLQTGQHQGTPNKHSQYSNVWSKFYLFYLLVHPI